MMCRAWYGHHRSWEASPEAIPPARVQTPARRSEDGISDTDRERTKDVLVRAFTEGIVRVDEFDQRLSQVYDAQTVADLEAIVAELPSQWLTDVAEEEVQRQRATKAGRRRREALNAYLRTMALLVGIWLVVGITAGAWYPWVLWPALGWGIPLLLGHRAHHRWHPPASRHHRVTV